MTFVLNTDVLLDHLGDNPAATRAFEHALLSGRRVTASVLSRIVLRQHAGVAHLQAIDAVELLLDWVPVDHEIAGLAVEHAARYGGEELDPVDLVVAATAERLGADLLTCHVERFPMFPALQPPY